MCILKLLLFSLAYCQWSRKCIHHLCILIHLDPTRLMSFGYVLQEATSHFEDAVEGGFFARNSSIVSALLPTTRTTLFLPVLRANMTAESIPYVKGWCPAGLLSWILFNHCCTQSHRLTNSLNIFSITHLWQSWTIASSSNRFVTRSRLARMVEKLRW